MEEERLKAVLESLLFAAGEPVSIAKIGGVLENVPRETIRKALGEMIGGLGGGGARGIVLEEVAGGRARDDEDGGRRRVDEPGAERESQSAVHVIRLNHPLRQMKESMTSETRPQAPRNIQKPWASCAPGRMSKFMPQRPVMKARGRRMAEKIVSVFITSFMRLLMTPR